MSKALLAWVAPLIPFFAAAAENDFSGTWTAGGVAFAHWTFRFTVDGIKVTGTVSQGRSTPTSLGVRAAPPRSGAAIMRLAVCFDE
jgi:hypothetical protein